jgi:DNA-binding MarR family transcriptional regulator
MSAIADVFAQYPATVEGNLPTDAEALRIATGLVRFHHAIDRGLGVGLFDNPALLMLLELFIARGQGRQTTVKVLTLASGVPQSTAQRWIDRLQAEKLVAKQINRNDRRSAYVTMSDHAETMIKALLGRLDAAQVMRAEHWA